MATFSERIKDLREQAKLTQEQVANAVLLNKQTISQYELGKRQPDFEKLERLCDFFNVSSDYMLGKSDVTLRYLNSDDLDRLNQKTMQQIPIQGAVVAGKPKEAISDQLGFLSIPADWHGEYGALKVTGDSMAPTLLEGDIVIYRKQADAASGDLVIAMVDGEDATVKKLIKNQSSVTLLPLNPAYDPLVFHKKEARKVRILGRVAESRRSF